MTTYTNQFLDQFYLIKSKRPWSLSSHHAMMAINFAAYNKQYNHALFTSIKKEFQKKGGWSNLFTSSSDELIYCLMMLNFESPLKSVDDIISIKKQMKQIGFYQSSHLTYCGLSLYDKEPQERSRITTRAYTLYKALKKSHPFITTSNEIPILFLLAENEEGESLILKNYEALYSVLTQAGFTKNNALQRTALALTLLPVDTNKMVESCLFFKAFFKENKMASHGEFCTILPLLIFNQIYHPADLNAIIDIQNDLKEAKSVKWLSRDEKLLLATCLKSIEKMHTNLSQLQGDALINPSRIFETIAFIQYMKASQQSGNAALIGTYS